MGKKVTLPKSLLIANRGEIACRIIHTCKKLAIRSVSIFSSVDADSKHVVLADDSYPLERSDSYLDIDEIISIALKAKAEAVHPGYGFLAENADFSRKVTEAGLLFIGPTSLQMQQLGDKIAAKQLAQSLKISSLPFLLVDKHTNKSTIKKFLEKTPGPYLVKSAAGGGGRGMRIVHTRADLQTALEEAGAEAQRAFADSRVFLEQLCTAKERRHIEVQVLGDGKGNIHLYSDRDCSIQRKHQKLIEECPAPNLAPPLRKAIHKAALKITSAVRYRNAGTVEFLVVGKKYYFLEVNTRLQVEHSVTEAAYGGTLDLVENQIRIAADQKIKPVKTAPPFAAIEVRLCAENDNAEFTPSSGYLQQLRFPHSEDIRIDTGYQTADYVPPLYDSLIAKIISHAKTRALAIEKLSTYLQSVFVSGIASNQALLLAVLTNSSFQKLPQLSLLPGIHEHLPDWKTRAGLVSLAYWQLSNEKQYGQFYLSIAAHQATSKYSENVFVKYTPQKMLVRQENNNTITLNKLASGTWKVQGTHGELTLEVRLMDKNFIATSFGAFFIPPSPVVGEQKKKSELTVTKGTKIEITSELPGKVISFYKKAGESVMAGEVLVGIDSMKLEHKILSPIAGTVQNIEVEIGNVVQAKDILLIILAS